MHLSSTRLALVVLVALLGPASLAHAQDATAGEDAHAEEPQAPEESAASPPAATPTEEAAPAETSAALTAPDEDVEEAAEEAAAQEEGATAAPAPASPPPYRGSIFGWQHGLTANTLNPAAQLSYNPTYYWSFFLQPRWYLDGQNFLVATLGAGIELTDSDFTTREQEFQLGDLAVEWRHTEVVEGFILITSTRLAAPTSLISIAAQRILNVGGGITAVRVFPELASLTIALAGAARYWIAASNTTTFAPGVEPPACFGYSGGDSGGTSSPCSGAGAVTTEQLRLTSSLTASVMPAPGLTLTMQYAFGGILGHGLGTAVNPAIGGPSTFGDERHHWRPITYWTIAAGYDVQPWLNVSLGYQSSGIFNTFWNDTGNVTNVFYNPESEIYLTATLAIDALVEAIEGDSEDGLTPEERQRRRQGLSAVPARRVGL